MAWVLVHLQRRGRETDSSKLVFNSETKCSMSRSELWQTSMVETRVSPSAAATPTSRWALAKSSSKTALRKVLPRPPSKPLRAASPPRAQQSVSSEQARIARLSALTPTPYAEASPTNHEIRQQEQRKRSAGKFWHFCTFWTTELLGVHL
jgi:hypothetical protein